MSGDPCGKPRRPIVFLYRPGRPPLCARTLSALARMMEAGLWPAERLGPDGYSPREGWSVARLATGPGYVWLRRHGLGNGQGEADRNGG